MGDVIERPALFEGAPPATAVRSQLHWPTLDRLRLSERDLADRCQYIGGSDANIILSGDAERILSLWREKRGEQAPVDLSGNLAVMLGCWTEPFNRLWFETVTGQRVSTLR